RANPAPADGPRRQRSKRGRSLSDCLRTRQKPLPPAERTRAPSPSSQNRFLRLDPAPDQLRVGGEFLFLEALACRSCQWGYTASPPSGSSCKVGGELGPFDEHSGLRRHG